MRNAVWLALLMTVGCGDSSPPLPKTFPVSGKVTYKGGEPLKGGLVQFQSAAEPDLTITGDIKPDGNYTLTTMNRQGNKVLGAAAGEYHVSLITPVGADQSGGEEVPLPDAKVETKENRFDFVLERAGKVNP